MSTGYLAAIFFLIGAALMLSLMGLLVALVVPGRDQWNERYFIIFFVYLTGYCCVCGTEALLYLYHNVSALLERIWLVEYVLAAFLMPMLTVYLLHCFGENWRQSRLFRAVTALWGVYLALLVINRFTEWFYYAEADNQFRFGPGYPLMVAPILAILLLDLTELIRKRSRLTARVFFACLAGLVPVTITLCIHMIIPAFQIYGLGMAICAIAMFGIILAEQVEQTMRQQQEIAHQRASIMVLQMRPHFIYNTMTSIYYLCKLDPEKAQQVIMDFTSYLRRNFTAIASEKTIPFTEELEHTRAYLAVEQAQFEDTLFVDYDIPHTGFYLPPLTLQPVVENAVKHGMDPDADPLHISIRTRETASGSEIVVENTGLEFEAAQNNEPHIALDNIRERLETMCGGTLEIVPKDQGGTIVRIWVPEKKKQPFAFAHSDKSNKK